MPKANKIETLKGVLQILALIAAIVFLLSVSVPFWKGGPVKVQATVNGIGNAQIESGGTIRD